MRTGVVVAGTVALALALSACGGSKGNTSSETSRKSETFNAGLNAMVNPSDKKGGTLKLANNDDVDSWDPARAYYAFAWNLQRAYYVRTLVTPQSAVGD